MPQPSPENQNPPPEHPGMSWAVMLCIIVVTICVAAGIAFRLAFPFFHGH